MIHIPSITKEVAEWNLEKPICSILLASKKERHSEKKYGNNKVQPPKPKRKDRIKKAVRIVNSPKNNVIEISANEWNVRSESDGNQWNRVSEYDGEYECVCKDHLYRNNKPNYDGCGHIKSVQLYINLKRQELILPQIYDPKNEDSLILPPVLLKCTSCDSKTLVKYGKNYLKSGVGKQKYLCRECFTVFVCHIDGFEYMMYDPTIVTQALDLVYNGLSYRKSARQISKIYRKRISHATIISWVKKFTKIIKYYVDKLRPILPGTWHEDELIIDVKDCIGTDKGKQMVMWNIIDHVTRFWLVAHISQQHEIDDARASIRKAKAITDTCPKKIVTDGYPGYPSAISSEFPRKDILSPPTTRHVVYGSFKEAINNNILERLHNEIREKLNTMRGFGNPNSTEILAEALRIYHNFVRENPSLGNRTPAEAAGIDLKLGDNKLYSLLRISAKKYNEDHKFIVALRKKKLLRHVKIEDKDGCIFVIPKSRYTDEIWLEIFNTLKKFGFEWKKIEDKWVWVKQPSIDENGLEGNHDGN